MKRKPYGYGVNQWPPSNTSPPPSIIAPVLALVVLIAVLAFLI